MPHLNDHDLRQFDDAYLETLSLEQARGLLGRALEDLKTARERLSQTPSNSSRPPSIRAPWEDRDDSEASPAQTPAEAESGADEAEKAPTEAPEEDGETPRQTQHRVVARAVVVQGAGLVGRATAVPNSYRSMLSRPMPRIAAPVAGSA